jgi:hypothetical protein
MKSMPVGWERLFTMERDFPSIAKRDDIKQIQEYG